MSLFSACTEGLKRCYAAVIQWGKDKSLTYTYAPPRERTLWAEKEQNMKYEFPRAVQEGGLSKALRFVAQSSSSPVPAVLLKGEMPSLMVLGSSHPRRWVEPGSSNSPRAEGERRWWKWFLLWKSLGSPHVSYC